MDWGLRESFILDVKRKRAVLYGNADSGYGYGYGEVRFSASTLPDIGRAVVAVVERGVGFNRVVRVHSAAVSQAQLMRCVGGSEVKWETQYKDTEAVREDSFNVLGRLDSGDDVDKEDVENAVLGLCAVGTWGAGYGGRFERTDNEALGIEVLSEEAVREVVEGVVKDICV